MISLRPSGAHAPVRRAAARAGAGLVALSPWRLSTRDDDATRARLADALAAPRVLFTSPAAVAAAARLQPLHARGTQAWFAVGAGTAAALRRHGVERVQAPARMDSEGLLALPGLARLDGDALGLVTAPGGRGVLQPALEARGARVVRADVYERRPRPLSPRALAALRALPGPAVLLLSSEEALRLVLAGLPEDLARRLRAVPVAAASGRLATCATAQGFEPVVTAASARPVDLVAAAARIYGGLA